MSEALSLISNTTKEKKSHTGISCGPPAVGASRILSTSDSENNGPNPKGISLPLQNYLCFLVDLLEKGWRWLGF
jgi:hypothetical protein